MTNIVARTAGLIVILLWLCVPLSAQDSTNPLLEMLQLVPDTEQTRDGVPLVSYADYRAIEAGRGIEEPLTLADFDNRTDAARLWIAATNSLTSGMGLEYFRLYLEGMEEAVGFSWFDIDRALTFGLPPGMGNILMGDFDAEAIADAFEARDYTVETEDDITLWCGANGCDDGLRQNLRNRNPANPFGGEFGREEPVALLPGSIIANSADFTVLSAMLDAYGGEQPSLADDPAVQTAVNFITATGTLRQAMLFNGADVGGYSGAVLTGEGRPDPLPVYGLAFFVDAYQGDEQIALVGLVYDDADSAATAAALIVDHLQMTESIRTERPFLEMIEERGGQITGAAAQSDAETGKSVALLEIRYPMPSNEKQQDGNYLASGMVFRLLIDSVYSRDATWLAAAFPAP